MKVGQIAALMDFNRLPADGRDEFQAKLAQLPIDSKLTTLCDAGRVEEYHAEAYELLAGNFVNTLKIKR